MAEHFFPLQDRREVAEGTMAFRFDTSGSDFAFEAARTPTSADRSAQDRRRGKRADLLLRELAPITATSS